MAEKPWPKRPDKHNRKRPHARRANRLANNRERCPDCGQPLMWHVIEQLYFCRFCDGREELHEAAELEQWAEYNGRDTREEWAGAR